MTSGLRVNYTSDCVGHLLAVPVDGDLQTPLGSGLNQLVDDFLYLILNIGHDPTPLQVYL